MDYTKPSFSVIAKGDLAKQRYDTGYDRIDWRKKCPVCELTKDDPRHCDDAFHAEG